MPSSPDPFGPTLHLPALPGDGSVVICRVWVQLRIVLANLLAILAELQRSSICSPIASLMMAMFKPSLQNINARGGEGGVCRGAPVDALQVGECPWDPEPVHGDHGQAEDAAVTSAV